MGRESIPLPIEEVRKRVLVPSTDPFGYFPAATTTAHIVGTIPGRDTINYRIIPDISDFRHFVPGPLLVDLKGMTGHDRAEIICVSDSQNLKEALEKLCIGLSDSANPCSSTDYLRSREFLARPCVFPNGWLNALVIASTAVIPPERGFRGHCDFGIVYAQFEKFYTTP